MRNYGHCECAYTSIDFTLKTQWGREREKEESNSINRKPRQIEMIRVHSIVVPSLSLLPHLYVLLTLPSQYSLTWLCCAHKHYAISAAWVFMWESVKTARETSIVTEMRSWVCRSVGAGTGSRMCDYVTGLIVTPTAFHSSTADFWARFASWNGYW